MIDFGFHNLDCMEGMKEFPDNYFDLAIVDPPYGDAKHIESSQFVQVERERERATALRLRIRGGTGSEEGSTSTNSRKNRWYMGE